MHGIARRRLSDVSATLCDVSVADAGCAIALELLVSELLLQTIVVALHNAQRFAQLRACDVTVVVLHVAVVVGLVLLLRERVNSRWTHSDKACIIDTTT